MAEITMSDVQKQLAELNENTKAYAGDKSLVMKIPEIQKELGELNESIKALNVKVNAPKVDAEVKDGMTYEKAAHAFVAGLGRAAQVQTKALSEGTISVGGSPITPPVVASTIVQKIDLISPVRKYANVLTADASMLRVPSESAAVNAAMHGESPSLSPGTETIGEVDIPLQAVSAVVDITKFMLQDMQAIDIQNYVVNRMAQRIALLEGTQFAVGNGTTPNMQGFVTGCTTNTVTSAAPTAIAYADLVSTLYAVPYMFRNNAVWACNASTIGKLRQITDSQNRPLFETTFQFVNDGTGVQAKPYDTILGRPVIEMPDMQNVAATNTALVCADFSNLYTIAQHSQGIEVLVDPYTQAMSNAIRIKATERIGAAVTNPQAGAALVQHV